MPETWFFYKVIVLLPLTKQWRLGRETSYSNSVGAISQGYFLLFSEVPPVSIPPVSGKNEGVSLQSLDGAGRHVGSVKVASPGRPDEPPASLLLLYPCLLLGCQGQSYHVLHYGVQDC